MMLNKKCAIGAALMTPVVIAICAAIMSCFVYILIRIPNPPQVVCEVLVMLIVGILFIAISCITWKWLYDHCINWHHSQLIKKQHDKQAKEKP